MKKIAEDIKILLDRIMMLNYNLCEYTKKLTSKEELNLPKIDKKIDTIESHRIGLTAGTSRSASNQSKSHFLELRKRMVLIPLR